MIKFISITLFVIATVFLFQACHEKEVKIYSSDDYVRFPPYYVDIAYNGTERIFQKSGTILSTKKIDTIYFEVNLIGKITNYDRKIKLEQYIPEDETVVQAEPGIDYIPFDDVTIQNLYIMPADSVVTNIPIIWLYNEDAPAYQTRRLNFKLVDSDDLKVGEENLYSKALLSIMKY